VRREADVNRGQGSPYETSPLPTEGKANVLPRPGIECPCYFPSIGVARMYRPWLKSSVGFSV
jgi:hypothetical protein